MVVLRVADGDGVVAGGAKAPQRFREAARLGDAEGEHLQQAAVEGDAQGNPELADRLGDARRRVGARPSTMGEGWAGKRRTGFMKMLIEQTSFAESRLGWNQMEPLGGGRCGDWCSLSWEAQDAESDGFLSVLAA